MNLLKLKKSSKKLTILKGKRKKNVCWLKIIANTKFINIKDIPPPRGFNLWWALLLFGKSGINLLKGFINNLVRNQVRNILNESIKRIFNIFKVNLFILIVNFQKN